MTYHRLCPLILSARETKTDSYANSVDPDETACNEDLHCLPFCFRLNPLFVSVESVN